MRSKNRLAFRIDGTDKSMATNIFVEALNISMALSVISMEGQSMKICPYCVLMICKIFLYLFFIHILFLNTNARAQSVYSEKADSLRKVLNEKTGTDKISVQLDLSLQLSKRDKEEAKQLAESALAEAKAAFV